MNVYQIVLLVNIYSIMAVILIIAQTELKILMVIINVNVLIIIIKKQLLIIKNMIFVSMLMKLVLLKNHISTMTVNVLQLNVLLHIVEYYLLLLQIINVNQIVQTLNSFIQFHQLNIA